MRSKNPACPNFMDKKNARFSQLHKTLDSYFHKLQSEGVEDRQSMQKLWQVTKKISCGKKV